MHVIRSKSGPLVLACLSSLLIAGCVGNRDNSTGFDGSEKFIELEQTPFYPQQDYQCGPASLATVLNTAGIDIGPDQLVDDVYLPARKGSLQIEMIATVRRYARVPYEPGYNLRSIMDQLEHNRPVLVLLNLGFRTLPVYHYAVVIGYDPSLDNLILRSGVERRALMARRKFIAAWGRSGYWSLIVLPPGVLPAGVDIDRYLHSVVALETVGQWLAAESSYRAVLDQWPRNTLAAFGLANALRAQGKLKDAVARYQYVLQLDDNHRPARNNLADTYLQLGQCGSARSVLANVERLENPNSTIDRAIQDTLSDLEASCPDVRN